MIRRALSRRAFVHAGGAALTASGLATAVSGPAAAGTPLAGFPEAAAAHPNPDADLIALGREWRASAERCDRLRALLDAAADRIRPIPAPEALSFRHDTDEGWISAFLGGVPRDGHLRYTAADQIGRLRCLPCPPAHARRRAEVLAAYDAWQDAMALEEDACGFTRAKAEDDAAREENFALRAAILSLPATTMAGVAVKVHVAVWCHGSIDDVAIELAENIAAGPATVQTAAASIVLDLARMLSAGRDRERSA